uniref:Immunoglobulin V-set domain-containing protein n=1 Tax=Haplochromis burtoni TaxID=8153 RepID=A0A3Q2XD65_HAPBU
RQPSFTVGFVSTVSLCIQPSRSCSRSQMKKLMTVIYLFIFVLFSFILDNTVMFLHVKVSVKAGKSISIPCFYHYQYRDHVKYLCEGYYWRFCKYAVKTNEADPLGKYLISDDKKEQIFTVTINHLTNQNTHYWCGLKNTALDNGVYFQLLVTNGKCLFLYSKFFFLKNLNIKQSSKIESLNRIENGIGIVKILSIPIPSFRYGSCCLVLFLVISCNKGLFSL